MDKVSQSFLNKQLGMLLRCNGSLAEQIKQFKESFSGREYQKGMTKLVLRHLLFLSKEGFTVSASPSRLDEFISLNNRFLNILSEIGAGGVYKPLLQYSADISNLPGARISEDQLSEWARQFKSAVMQIMAVCYFRKNSINPPY